jgi:hypothetical protein
VENWDTLVSNTLPIFCIIEVSSYTPRLEENKNLNSDSHRRGNVPNIRERSDTLTERMLPFSRRVAE